MLSNVVKFSYKLTDGQPSKRVIRTDIQCLRALAIFAVLGFHLWPQVFSLGYLGVDVFFVISGYLMTSILSRSSANKPPLTVLLDFYNRRAKRILPPYVFAIFGTVLVCQFILSRSDFIDLKEDTIWALGIATNMKTIWKKQQYFDSTHLYKFLLHTWSLGLEMQYYVFAPVILGAVARCPRPLLLVSLISVISFAAQCFITDAAMSFGFVGCRLWQFMIGTAAFYVSRAPGGGYTLVVDEESQTDDKRETNLVWKKLCYTVTAILLSLSLLLPFISETVVQDTSTLTRLISSALTGVTIAFGVETTIIFPIPSQISKTLHYVGDISYSVYLVHWPLIVLAKYQGIFTPHYTFAIIVAIFALGIAQYTLFEKPLSKRPAVQIYAVVLLLSIASVAILRHQNAIHSVFGNPKNYEADENLNEACWVRSMAALETCKKPKLKWLGDRKFKLFFCEFEGTGSLTVLIAGNSITMYSWRSLLKFGKHKIKKLYVAAQNGCSIHKKLPYLVDDCTDLANHLPQTLAEIKPDIVIVNQRLRPTEAFNTPMKDEKTDLPIVAMREDWAMISNYTKKIIIVEPYVSLPESFDLLKPLRLNETDLSVYSKSLEEFKADVDPGWDRVIKSVDNCPKCKLINIRNYLCNTKSCAIYDAERRRSLYCDFVHHAPTAVKRYMPSIVRELEI